MSPKFDDVLLTTTDGLDGRQTRSYLGLVHGEVLCASEPLATIASRREPVLVDAGAGGPEVERAREMAITAMAKRARELGANVVLGVRCDCTWVGGSGPLLLVRAYGTAAINK